MTEPAGPAGGSAPGTLYVVATPIGNLDDWSGRAAQVLGEVDLIACEDTRHTGRLLARYGIRRPLESYHEFNEEARAGWLVERLAGGARIALVSDAGTPGISDPGYRLVRMCRERDIPVVPVPGPSALIAALAVSGLPTDGFLFVGFLPARAGQRRRRLEELRGVGATLIFYEAPQRVRACVQDLLEVLGDREAFVAREMTKLHEEHLFGRLSDLGPRLREQGEFVLVVAGGRDEAVDAGPDVTAMTRQEVLKEAAHRLGIPRKQLYDILYRKE